MACKYGKVKSGARKGKCKLGTRAKVAGKRGRRLTGAARYAKQCKGNKGAAFKSCMSHALDGLRRR
jgi:hypothetical protein